MPLQVGDPPRLLREVGFGAVSWWPKPQHIPLLQGLDPHELVLHWHGDRCLLPASAQLLALSLHCPEQAFCLSPSAYGLQFHIEIDSSTLERWLDEDAAFVIGALGENGPERIREEA